ncbi:MAG: hypothetical protein ABI877_07365, partial [Gemmatimonadaceae bacterium]
MRIPRLAVVIGTLEVLVLAVMVVATELGRHELNNAEGPRLSGESSVSASPSVTVRAAAAHDRSQRLASPVSVEP